jgi:hypothetical protein
VTLSSIVSHVSKLSQTVPSCLDFSSHCQFPQQHGKLFLWILLKVCRAPAISTAFWWSLIPSRSTVISYPLLHPFTAADVAKLFLNNVYRLHGLPSAIVSDRDCIFTSHFWKELFRLADVSLQMSSSYHPQSDS